VLSRDCLFVVTDSDIVTSHFFARESFEEGRQKPLDNGHDDTLRHLQAHLDTVWSVISPPVDSKSLLEWLFWRNYDSNWWMGRNQLG